MILNQEWFLLTIKNRLISIFLIDIRLINYSLHSNDSLKTICNLLLKNNLTLKSNFALREEHIARYIEAV